MSTLTEYDLYNVIRPLPNGYKLDNQDMPIMKRVLETDINVNSIEAINIQNLSSKKDSHQNLTLTFNYDKSLLKYWNNPLKYIPLFQRTYVVSTPDYSIYDSMNLNEIRHNTYMNRWLGCLWQSYGCTVIPTISWAGKQTYDICFSGIQPGGIVIISTIGCQNNILAFLEGFLEMKKRLNPSLIIVYGKIISGMYGRFINYSYEDCFNKKPTKQLSFEFSPIFEVKESE